MQVYGAHLAFRDLDIHVGERDDVAVARPVAFIELADAYADHAEQGYGRYDVLRCSETFTGRSINPSLCIASIGV